MSLTICIRLNPAKLKNPEIGLRHSIPETIEELSSGQITSDGFDYIKDSQDMLIYMKTDSESTLKFVLEVIEHTEVDGNDLAPAATVTVIDANKSQRQIFPMG